MKQSYVISENVEVEGGQYVKDLGVYVDNQLNWKVHVNTKCSEARQKASWILRTFVCREQYFMILLFQIFVRSILEYCSPLWSPYLIGQISKIEAIQRSFTAKIKGLEGLNYWERLEKTGLYSLQRRRERYSIILVWKIMREEIPNDLNLTFNYSAHRGATCIRRLGNSRVRSVNTTIYNSFSSVGPALFNIVPAEVKSSTELPIFKSKLDNWLRTFPDKPPTPGYIAANHNSLLEWARSGSQ